MDKKGGPPSITVERLLLNRERTKNTVHSSNNRNEYKNTTKKATHGVSVEYSKRKRNRTSVKSNRLVSFTNH